MDKFTEKEKNDLRKAAKSGKLRDDFQSITRNRFEFRAKDGKVDVDSVIRFVAGVNALIDHAPKPFKAITGKNFRM